MDREKLIKGLIDSTNAEREVFYYFARGRTRGGIAKLLSKKEGTVGNQLRSFTEKFSRQFPKGSGPKTPEDLRDEIGEIYKQLFPNHQDLIDWEVKKERLQQELDEITTPPRRVVFDPEPDDEEESEPEPEPREFPRWIFLLVAGVVICAAAIFVIFQVRSLFLPNRATQPTRTPTPRRPTRIPTWTQVEEVVPPIDTAIPVTPTITNTPTPIVTPTPYWIFKDDFDEGVSDDWQRIYGDYHTIDGKITTDGSAMIAVGETTWDDYQITLDYESGDCTSGRPFEAVAVRMMEENHMLVLNFTACHVRWFAVRNGGWKEIEGSYKGIWEGYKLKNLRIVAEGDRFSTFVNGELVKEMSISGFPTGKVGLMFTSHVVPSYMDNFIILEVP